MALENKLAKETETFEQQLVAATINRQTVEASLARVQKEVEEKDKELQEVVVMVRSALKL